MKHPESSLGEPGPMQGVNTGVVLLDLKGMRDSAIISKFLEPDELAAACEDQDWWNMVTWSAPHLRYNLDCGFNYQVSQDFNNEIMDEVNGFNALLRLKSFNFSSIDSLTIIIHAKLLS